MLSRFKHHTRSTEYHLRRQLSRRFTGQADFHTGFDEGLDDDVHERRTTGAQSCDGIHVFLIKDESAADATKNFLSFATCSGVACLPEAIAVIPFLMKHGV